MLVSIKTVTYCSSIAWCNGNNVLDNYFNYGRTSPYREGDSISSIMFWMFRAMNSPPKLNSVAGQARPCPSHRGCVCASCDIEWAINLNQTTGHLGPNSLEHTHASDSVVSAQTYAHKHIKFNLFAPFRWQLVNCVGRQRRRQRF